ncbi:hypothetical protein C6I21_08885 [Alkalicoccus urumqiensis]|uniref:Flagellar export chaperone FliS n=1 Tax=Alkalicoccus urumqiensis TaxID=1548213 RepID=A0A2P6MH83_ALKUR|nr:hypothetical protein C6I21_08885 [Alkalicoccus urumqiensis]
MAMHNPYAKYKQTSIETKSAGELTLMLYDGCLTFISRAREAIEQGKMEAKNTNLIKAQNIIRELMVTLDEKAAVSADMMPMYDYILNQLIEANTQNDLAALKNAESFTTDFRDTWKEVIKLDRQNRYGGGKEEAPKAAGQPVGRITPVQKEVPAEEAPTASATAAAVPKQAPSNPYAKAASNNPYAKAKQAAQAAAVRS